MQGPAMMPWLDLSLHRLVLILHVLQDANDVSEVRCSAYPYVWSLFYAKNTSLDFNFSTVSNQSFS